MEYLLKSMLCLLVLLLIHRVLLQREVLHRFNRFFLLGAVVGSFLIPLYTIEVPVEKVEPVGFEALALEENEALEYENFSAVEEAEIAEVIPEEGETEKLISYSSFPWEKALWLTYMMVSAVFLIRFFGNLNRILAKIRHNLHVQYRGEILVLHSENQSPFSFLKYIFYPKREFEKSGIPEAVFVHERCHVEQKHSWDVLFIELLLVFFWFHPGLYLARQAIKLNHEFIADEAALRATSLEHYRSQLLSMMVSGQPVGLASSLNFPLTKKRFEMMKRKTKSSTKWLKLLGLVPLIGTLVYFFGEKVEVLPEEVLMDTPSVVIETPVEEVETHIRILNEKEVEVDGVKVPIHELAKSLDEIKASNPVVRFSANPGVKMGTLADVQEILRGMEMRRVVFDKQGHEWETSSKEKDSEEYYRHAYILVEDENMDYNRKSYGQLTEEEKKPLPGPFILKPTGSPDPALYEKWKDKETYSMWIDGMDIENDRLNDYSALDFKYYFQSGVIKNARSKRFPQPYQVHLYTKEYGPPKPLTDQDTITLTQRGATWTKDIQKYPDPITAYLQKNARYEKLRTSGTIYDQKSPEEKALLDSLYLELSDEYSQSSDKRKKSLKEPISPDSDIPRNGGSSQNSSEKIAVRTVSNSRDEGVLYSLVPSAELQSDDLKEYLTLYGQYQTRAYENRLFAQPVNLEILHQQKLFRTLEAKYNGLSFEERRRVKRADFPYVKLEKDGKEVFVKIEDLTPQQRKELGC